MKKILRISILAVMILLMICVWPLCLLRKTEETSSCLTAPEYGKTEAYISREVPYVQSFIARTARLEYLEFKLHIAQDIAEQEGALHVQLWNEDGEPVLEEDLAFGEYTSYFWHVDVGKWLQKGRIYQLQISVDDEYSETFQGLYTLHSEEHAPGSVSLQMGEKKEAGQGLVRYGYSYPLNLVNVVCIWSAIAAMGLSLYLSLREKNTCRYQCFWDKLWGYFSRHQLWILLVQMAGLMLLTLYLCRNRAVDWDEAYSLTMVSRLTLGEMLHTTALDMHPPLYYLILRAFSAVFGNGIFTLKLLSVVINGCVMVLGITLIRKNWGAKAAFLYHLVIGIGSQFIFYSVNIRMYALALFFVVWNGLLAYEIIREGGRLKWVLFVLSGLGGVYTHYFTVVPLILIYAFLLTGLFLEQRNACKYFFLSCGATIAGYLPWLIMYTLDNRKGVDEVLGHLPWMASVLKSFARDSVGSFNFSKVKFMDLAEWMFRTNIKASVVIGISLFVVAVLLFIIRGRHYTRKKRLFLEMCGTNFILSYVVIAILASGSSHFLDNRYVFAALGNFWLFVVILISENGRVVSALLAVYLGIWGLSAWHIQKDAELGTNAYITESYRVLEQVRGEEEILYNFPTYHILYGAHLPRQKFIWIEDMDWDNYEQDYIYFISWGPIEVPWEIQQRYEVQFTDCGTMRFEEGMGGIKLFKLCWKK